jgi:hypothetical protein
MFINRWKVEISGLKELGVYLDFFVMASSPWRRRFHSVAPRKDPGPEKHWLHGEKMSSTSF